MGICTHVWDPSIGPIGYTHVCPTHCCSSQGVFRRMDVAVWMYCLLVIAAFITTDVIMLQHIEHTEPWLNVHATPEALRSLTYHMQVFGKPPSLVQCVSSRLSLLAFLSFRLFVFGSHPWTTQRG